MNKLFIFLALMVSIIMVINMVSAEEVTITVMGVGGGNPGSIWTTRDDCGDEQQDVNHYYPGEEVWINGKNFDADDYDWTIKGQPGGASCDPATVVASGTETVDASGSFCFNAYTVANDDCGEYTVDFGKKNDNYHVIPEFGLVVGMLTVLSAVAVFFIVRRK